MGVCTGATAAAVGCVVCVVACAAGGSGACAGRALAWSSFLLLRLLGGFAVGETGEGLDVFSDFEMRRLEFLDGLVHSHRRARKVMILRKVVQNRIVVRQHAILDFNLGCQQARDEAVDGGHEVGETVSEGVVGVGVGFCGHVEVCFGFGHGGGVAI